MPNSLFSAEFQTVFSQARDTGGTPKAFPSPIDWRDQWIYFLMVDRFNNSTAAPKNLPFDAEFNGFQGGTFAGIEAQLPYIKALGAGAIWLSPVLQNVAFEGGTYHGYGIHHFLRADPRFAQDPAKADEELRALVDSAHNQGLYIILDIVLNHTGNVFAYLCDPGEQNCVDNEGAQADFRQSPRNILWRAANGSTNPPFPDIATIPNPDPNALVWPSELHDNSFFRRQGTPGSGDDTIGDFASLKQFRTDITQVQQFLIRAYQYVIARFDVDGFRIDTLRYLKGGLPLLFGNSIREFALSSGKKNFFTFGEVFVGDAEEEIARFIGRTTTDQSDMVGVDAALDYPLFFNLKPMVKGFAAPSDLVNMYHQRKTIEAGVLSSHGDATRFFVTFLDNHDVKERIRFVQQGNEHQFDDQVTMGLGCLYSLPGIPCLYYGTEQGLHGVGSDLLVREALWGGPGFQRESFYYKEISQLAQVRASIPALRYGRFYFRPISGDGRNFGVSTFPQGILAFSRILMDQEVVIAANCSTSDTRSFDVIVDDTLNKPADQFNVRYSNKSNFQNPAAVQSKPAGSVSVQEVDGGTGTGPLCSVHISLAPLEVQILSR
jgi:glycosidase